MKNLTLKFWPILVIFGLTFLIAWPIFLPGYFSHHDDLQVMRVFEMRKCLLDFQIPCRWVPDMGYGNGYPLFNYYSVLPYYIGAILSFPLGFLVATKLLFAIPLFLGGVSMYFLARELFGKIPAVTAAITYTFAPYHALDTFVRGDVTESFAMALIPLAFYFALRLIREGGVKNIFGLSVSLGLFLISHNIMTVLFIPILLVICTFWLISEKRQNFAPLIISFSLSVGLAAFFIFPAYFERNLVQIDNLIRLDLDFRAHFVTVNQLLLDRFWGYGASSPGTNDTISFQIGWPHWLVALVSILVFAVGLRSASKPNFITLLFFGIFIFSVFMAHIKSAFIWEKIEILKFTQFPWRFLAVAIFSASLLGASLIQNFKDSYGKYVAIGVIILTIALNWNFFRPKEFFFDLTNQKKLSGRLWEDQQKAAILDYLPTTAVQPRETAPSEPIIVSGKATVEHFDKKSNRWKFQAKVEDSATIEVPVFDFPVWNVKVNDQDVDISNKNYLGRISVSFDKGGEYFVTGSLTDTPIRRISNILSLLSFTTLAWILIYGKNTKFLT